MKKTKLIVGVVIAIVTWSFIGGVNAAKAETSCQAPVLITGFQTGAAPTGSTSTNFRYEYVELFNCSSEVVPLSGYNLGLKNSAGAVLATVVLQGELGAGQFTWAVHSSYKTYLASAAPQPAIVLGSGNLNALGADGGTISVKDLSGNIIDEVNYGAGEDLVPVPPSGQAVKRCTANGAFVDSGAASDFLLYTGPALSSLFMMGPDCPIVEPPVEEPPIEDPQPPSQLPCEQLVISEVLPNPAGADGGKEFIELYNPTQQTVNLQGCSLRVDDGEPFMLPNETLTPNSFRTFLDVESELTLPNSAGGVVWLIGAISEQSVAYPGSLGDDLSWAMIGSEWRATTKPTPGLANELMALATTEDETSCPAGKERNPKTNRCRSIATDEAPTPCKVGQERNLETGRCRTIVTAAAQPTPCKPGQERNPETNRCRTIVAATVPEPCAEGQERNPETGRCRKILAADLSKTVEDVSTPQTTDPKWWLMGLAAAGLAGYGVYEWRRDIGRGLSKLKKRFSKQ